MKQRFSRLLPLVLLITAVACGGGGAGGGASDPATGGDSGGSTIAADSPLGEGGSVAGGTEATGTTVGAGDYRPPSLPSGAADPSFIITGRISVSAAHAVITGQTTLDGKPAAEAIVTAVLTRSQATVVTQTTLTATSGGYAVAFASPKQGDIIYVSAAKEGRNSNTVKLEVDILGKVDELGNVFLGMGGANLIGPGTLYQPTHILIANFPISASATQKMICVSDTSNNRVLCYNPKATQPRYAQAVLCQANFVTSTAFLFSQVIDNTTSGETHCTFPGPLAYDPDGRRFFVADRYRILVFDLSEGLKSGMTASRVLGVDNLQSFAPSGSCDDPQRTFSRFTRDIEYDRGGRRLFVADEQNNRILVFSVGSSLSDITNCMAASHVIGQPNFTATASGGGAQGLHSPFDVAWDPVYKRLYTSDGGNSRLLVYDLAGSLPTAGLAATWIIGRSSFDDSTYPTDCRRHALRGRLTLTASGEQLYLNGDGIRRFSVGNALGGNPAPIPTSDIVIGYENGDCGARHTPSDPRALFTTGRPGGGLAVDSETGRLWAADIDHNRVLVYDPSTFALDQTAQATDCLGQLTTDGSCDFSTTSENKISQSSFNNPLDVVLDETHLKIYVADTDNARVVVYHGRKDSKGSLIPDDPIADFALGSAAGIRPTVRTGAPAELGVPSSLVLANGYLFVGDEGSYRISVFEVANGSQDTLATEMEAGFIIGRPQFNDASYLNQFDFREMAVDCTGRYLFLRNRDSTKLMCFDLEEGGTSLPSRIAGYKSSKTLQSYNAQETGVTLTFGGPFVFSKDSCQRFYIVDIVGPWPYARIFDYSGGCAGFSEVTVNGKRAYVDSGAPRGLATSSSGQVLFLSGESFNAIGVADMNALTFTEQVGLRNLIGQDSWQNNAPGVAEGKFYRPDALALTSDDRYLYVIDNGNGRLQIVKNPLCAGFNPGRGDCQ